MGIYLASISTSAFSKAWVTKGIYQKVSTGKHGREQEHSTSSIGEKNFRMLTGPSTGPLGELAG